MKRKVFSYRLLVLGCFIAISISLQANAASLPPPGECPQPRFTGKAPVEIYRLKNPLPANKQNINAGKRLYLKLTQPPCSSCHGESGDGKGAMADMFDPPPRNFACAETINGIPDGQLYWIIRHGSPGTGMPGHEQLTNDALWQLVLYIRHLSD